MTTVMQKIVNVYYDIFEEKTDPRTRGWLFASPEALFSILAAYLFFCCYWGPKYMKDIKPFKLKKLLLVYNLIQIVISVYIVIGAMAATYLNGYSYTCQPIDWTNNPQSQAVHKMAYAYYVAKLTELLDTIFFVLRKKNNQVTFLHVYHHSSMPIFTYFGFRYYPNGHAALFAILNSLVHVFMYTYYLIAGLGPKYQKYLWWKKHVTTIQLIQFAMIFMHNFPPLFTSCTYPKFLHVILCMDSALFFYMFGKFYIKSYIQKKENKIPNGKDKTRID